MKIYEGYPERIEVTDKESLENAERLILHLMWDRSLPPATLDSLYDQYMYARTAYLDSIFEWTDENRERISVVSRLVADECRNLENTLRTIGEVELAKREEGLRPAKVIEGYVEVPNEDFHDEIYNDLWGFFFSISGRESYVCRRCLYVDNGYGRVHDWPNRRFCSMTYETDWTPYDGLNLPDETKERIKKLKESLLISWQDLANIREVETRLIYRYG